MSVMKNNILRIAFLVTVLSFLLPVDSYALSGTTKDGYYFCMSESFFLELVSYMDDEDAEGVKDLLEDKKCAELKGGLGVTVTKRSGLLGSRIEIDYKGVKVWTYREAVDVK
jgi:hypothetical protein